MQLIPLTGFTRKLPLFETRCAGYFVEIVLRGGQPDIAALKNARAGMTAAILCACSQPRSTGGSRHRVGHLFTGLIGWLSFQGDLKPTSALMP